MVIQNLKLYINVKYSLNIQNAMRHYFSGVSWLWCTSQWLPLKQTHTLCLLVNIWKRYSCWIGLVRYETTAGTPPCPLMLRRRCWNSVTWWKHMEIKQKLPSLITKEIVINNEPILIETKAITSIFLATGKLWAQCRFSN